MARRRYYRNSGLPQKYAKEYTAWNNMKRRCDSPCTEVTPVMRRRKYVR